MARITPSSSGWVSNAKPDLEEEGAQAAAAVVIAEAEMAAVNAGVAKRSDDMPPMNDAPNNPFAGNLANVGVGAAGAEPVVVVLAMSSRVVLSESEDFDQRDDGLDCSTTNVLFCTQYNGFNLFSAMF